MDDFTVDKAKLITKLKKNRKKHLGIYEEAVRVYRKRMIAELEQSLRDAKNGGAIRRSVSLPLPENHTEDFDAAIDMLEWNVADQVELTERVFRQLVRNEWGWLQSFESNTSIYAAGGALS